AISVSSAIVHNLVQNIVYCLQLGSFALFSYSPYLVVLAVFAGIVVGISATLIVNYKKLPFYAKVHSEEERDQQMQESEGN
ncbi:MAG: hypothetical protein IKC00_00235, partial [Clostridia bacterium]|nr:hypothetical protein [Clostridia bacterium]